MLVRVALVSCVSRLPSDSSILPDSATLGLLTAATRSPDPASGGDQVCSKCLSPRHPLDATDTASPGVAVPSVWSQLRRLLRRAARRAARSSPSQKANQPTSRRPRKTRRRCWVAISSTPLEHRTLASFVPGFGASLWRRFWAWSLRFHLRLSESSHQPVSAARAVWTTCCAASAICSA